MAQTSCNLHVFISTPKSLTPPGVFTRDKQVLFTAAVSAACLCVPDYWGNACDMTNRKVWRAQTVKSPLAPAYKQKGKAFFFFFYEEEFMDGKGRTGRWGGGQRRERPGRNYRRTDPVRVQTRADTSQKSQTKHGRIIRAIIQPRSQSARCMSLCPFCLEGQQPTLSFSPKLNSLNMLLLSFFPNAMAAAQSPFSSDGNKAAVQQNSKE